MAVPWVVATLIATEGATAGQVSRLRVVDIRLPSVANAQVRTSGSFPVLASSDASSARVNATLEQAVRTDEHRFAVLVKSEKVDPRTAPGVYRMAPTMRFISASSVVFSMLVPTRRVVPGLNGGDSWFAITILSHNDRIINLGDLFSNTREGRELLSRVVRERLAATNRCVRNSLRDPVAGHAFRHALNATVENYRDFALLSTGLAVGFAVGQVAYPACGRVDVVIPYRAIAAVSSRFGRNLMESTRAPA